MFVVHKICIFVVKNVCIFGVHKLCIYVVHEMCVTVLHKEITGSNLGSLTSPLPGRLCLSHT